MARAQTERGGLAPVLLIGAGGGEATCGILYLGGYLRRHGVEAFVRLYDPDETEEDLAAALGQLVKHVRPRLVGISLKWFHHVARAKLIAKTLRRLDPSIQILLGGNSASFWWKELCQWTCVDHVALGDGEVPLLALARGGADAPNIVSRATGKPPRQAPFGYVQSPASADVYYSHFDQLFLSQLDLHSFSGWVAPGKGCGENCLYCGGTRGVQKATFGRARPFLRPEASVQKDHREVAPRAWQLRYDFAGSTPEFLERAWAGTDLSRHATTYFLWGVPPPGLMETLSRTFQRVFMVLDIGCFSETQRLDAIGRGLLKPCPTDAELSRVIEAARRHSNLELEISGIAGLPFATAATLEEERRLVNTVLGLGCAIGYQRLEAQPGALVTEHPERFGMASEAQTMGEFVDYFEARGAAKVDEVPMLRFLDSKFEAAVDDTFLELDAAVREHETTVAKVAVTGRTRLRNASAATREFPLGEWLGPWRVPARVRKEPVTVVRSVDGTGLACAPSLDPRRFSDPMLDQGEAAVALLAALEAFDRPSTVDAAVARLTKTSRFDPESAREVIEHLAAGRFLQAV